jgi:hypothetical protein
MAQGNDDTWVPFRPNADDLKASAEDVSEIPAIQQKQLVNHGVRCPDRVAHEYQIAGGKVIFKVGNELPGPLQGVGLFQPGTEYVGIGRISTGLGTPHIETNPDFLGIRLAFQTKDGRRVDFLGLNAPSAPTDNHRDFMSVLHATGESAAAHIPLIGNWGEYKVADLVAEQAEFGVALAGRMGPVKAGKTLLHLTSQTIRTFHSSTAYQPYWTGIEEAGGIAGKFTLVPTQDENQRPGFRPGERHLTQEWKERQAKGDVVFQLYWISFLNQHQTSTTEPTKPWEEGHKQLVGTIRFPKMDPGSDEAALWAILASEMGANPGNWIHDKENSIHEPSTEFGLARKLAYQKSQEGRGVLEPKWYQPVFETAKIGPDLAQELRRRQDIKSKAGHVNSAPA